MNTLLTSNDDDPPSSFTTTNYLSLLWLARYAADEVTRTLARDKLLDNLHGSCYTDVTSANEELPEHHKTLV